ncbi:MAG: orotidine-5'-phosphate decarboxylase [Thermoguttaceae bacterium]
MNSFIDRLADAVGRLKNPVLVGLDPRIESLPKQLLPSGGANNRNEQARAYKQFCKGVIDVVAPLVPAVKPQAAFFEQLGPDGMGVLAEIMAYAREKGLLVILDGKRNDIGSTATAYAQGFLGAGGQSPWGADALTVNPYLGEDSLQPFIDVALERSAGVFVLVKTSNPGGGMIQDLSADGKPVFAHVAEYVERMACQTAGDCGYGIVGAVVGATYPRQLVELRAAMPHAWFLVPGYGAQGGSAADVAGAFDGQGKGAIINNSRGIIFAHAIKPYCERFGPSRWQEAVEFATLDMIARLRADTPAGRL